MRRFLYPLIALFLGGIIYVAANGLEAAAAPEDPGTSSEPALTAPEPNYLITDANALPPR